MPKCSALPSKARILSLYRYDSETGQFFKQKNGTSAGAVRPSGHVFLTIDGRPYGAHRIAFMLHYGSDPGPMFVDHINHDPADNRPGNLRLASLQENTRHMRGCRRDSSTGVRGVRWRERDSRWYALITIDGKKKYLGSYVTKEEAALTVMEARRVHFGEFAGGMDAPP